MNNFIKKDIVIAGEGGQGIQTIADIFSSAAILNSYKVTYLPSFGVEQRGAPSIAYIIISKSPIRCPKFSISDYAIILSKRSIPAVQKYLSPSTKIIFDSSAIDIKDMPVSVIHLSAIPATKYAFEKFFPKSLNILMLGVLTNLFLFDRSLVWKELQKKLQDKFNSGLDKEKTREAFIFGCEAVLEEKNFSSPDYNAKHKIIVHKEDGKEVVILPTLCKGCMICREKCPVAAISEGEEYNIFGSHVPDVNLERCITCGNCRMFCPDGAIEVNKIKDSSMK